MRILIVGAGAVGGYFGARLAAAGREVTFLLRARRAGQLQRDGLRLVSPHGDLTVRPRWIEASRIAQPYDLILLGVKAYALDGAMEDFAAAVGPDTMILPLLNGMRHIERLVARFGEKPVLGGVCRVVAELRDDGRIVQMAPMQSLAYGERGGGISDRIRAVDAALRGAGFATVLSDDIEQAMWDKWAFLASLAGICCLFGGSVGQVVSVPDGARAARALCDEALSVAAAHGFPLAPAVAEQAIAGLTDAGSTITASMYRDRQAGGPVEVEQILGDLVERADAQRIDVPLLRAAAVSLRVYEVQRIRQEGR
ncbi:2-dehydropantoate 2-reductase [Castellaniella defragrans 65Phen]|uniref:2-dehydropantoate 2-reductase n=1 Tax=Castellaniella defragrans (strain DSM 12143 / CCUG 39792 / 65Phen) TaxID=1437824 RepID=W8WVJ4_CASD6|nr:ketopantoate reductase family protein [Castellaniella defragrans]CDM23703.1 2-dehydropantoate 2-reductase [Castellaniella defragrans 65Phen]